MMEVVNRLRGQVTVRVETPFPERLLNVCAQRGLAFWDVRRVDDVTLRVCMDPKGFRKLRADAAELGCTLRAEGERGLPFFARRFRKRYALVLGGLLCAALLYGMSLFIWEFEVVGAQRLSSAAILQALSDVGVRVGSYAPGLNNDDIQNKMLLKLDELAWITVNVRGSSATVEVRERIPKPPVIDEGMPCNIIARKAGVVERMDTLAGKPAAQQGQTVDKGQLLVSGIVDVRRDGGYTGARFIRADARVTARTWYDVEGCLLTAASGKRYTGRNRTRNTLVVAGRRFPLYTDAAIPFDRYDTMVSGRNVVLGSGDTAVTFPVALITEIYSEYVETELTLPAPTAEAQLRASLELRLQELLGSGELLSSETELTPSPTVLRGRLRAEAREEIAQRADVLTGMAIVEG